MPEREEFWRAYRRNLPHIRMAGAIYFVTWRLRQGHDALSPDERSVVADALRFFHQNRYDLLAYVVMNDHVHVLVQPLERWRLESLVQSWKSWTTRELQRRHHRRGAIWLDEYFDRVTRNDDELDTFAHYIFTNPMKRWPGIHDYTWVGGRFFSSNQE